MQQLEYVCRIAMLLIGVLLYATVGKAGDDTSPVTRWDFGTEEASPLRSHGNVQRDQAGPRPPEFPRMPENNTAVQVDTTAYLSVPDTGSNSDFDFTNGDAITIEAWVNPSVLREGQVSYVVGKGRTGSPKFSRDNQNWSLRVVGAQKEAKLSFLFATKLTSSEAHWHRWDSRLGFPAATGWHHIAIAYRFGDPKSIRGWINGEPTEGNWSYGGETEEPPVVDNDEIRIGNGFAGMLDAIAVHRALLDDKTVASRFHRVGEPRVVKPLPEVMPELADIPEGRVLVQLCAGLPASDRWPNEGEQWPAESARWVSDAFLISRLPLKYDGWGIRSAWKAPVLLRVAADVQLPTGAHRLMMRGRALGRLWINGKVVARTKAITKRPPDGEEPITPVAVPPLPGVRVHGYHQQEVFGETTIESSETGKSRVVLELVVGGKDHRTETGEVCVALLSADGMSYELLTPGPSMVSLTDASIEPLLLSIEASLAQLDDLTRRQAAASQDGFWSRRHELARKWVKEDSSASSNGEQTLPQVVTPKPNVESVTPTGTHPIDAFIAAKIARATAESAGEDSSRTEHFHGKVLPILSENCFRCHGEKDKGGLKLDSRTAALQAGDSQIPAIVPGNLDASELVRRIRDGEMPPTEDVLTKQEIALLEQWVQDGALWPAPPIEESEVALAPVIGDAAFMRRVFLDTVGVPPTVQEVRAFLIGEPSFVSHDKGETGAPRSPIERRQELVDQLLLDERFADGWMSFWLDLLAENPTLLNQSMGSTGPFRWFLYDALRDNKPLDRMVTELILMRGDAAQGGSAGFAMASENDSPMAAKGHILASAFLGIELECARCHDSPYHSTTQKDLYSLAAMLSRKALTVPKTSQVPAAFFEEQKTRQPLIQVTLRADQSVPAKWPFAQLTGVTDGESIARLMQNPNDSRERLAALITAPQNARFSRVVVNRIWKKLIGAGLVEPVHDWEGSSASHPELLNWLADELISHNYDFRHIVRLIVTSKAYQRAAVGRNLVTTAEMRFFNAPDRRRLTAEQIVDSLHHATGQPIDVEELTFVHDGRRELGHRQTLGTPTRAWMFGDLKNERDRPSLSLPRARAVVDVLEAFGWTGARQMPITVRESDPNVLQPGILANGILSMSLTRAAHQSALSEIAITAESPQSLVDTLFLRTLTRFPKPDERRAFSRALVEGFESRLLPADMVAGIAPHPPLPQVTWFNHGRAKANEIQLEIERRVRAGPPADPRLEANWRSAFEDVMWSLINHREFVWMP